MPQEFVTVDRDKVIKQGVAINDVYRTLQTFMGGYFVNYFNRFGRQWQVYVEAEGDYRTKAENVGQFYVRNAAGEMVPAFRAHEIRIAQWPGIHHAIQRISIRAIKRLRRAGIQHRSGDEGAGGDFRPNHAARDGLRLFRHVVPGKEGAGRRVSVGDLRILAACLSS